MAAAIKAINAKVRSNKVLDYFFSTRMFTKLSVGCWPRCDLPFGSLSGEDGYFCSLWRCKMLTIYFVLDFWGPASNFGIPIAAVMDIQKDPEM
jgi:mitochondrial pyruvate carrier 1